MAGLLQTAVVCGDGLQGLPALQPLHLFAGRAHERVGAAAERREQRLLAKATPRKTFFREIEDALKLYDKRLPVDERRPFAPDRQAPQLRRTVSVAVEDGVVRKQLGQPVRALGERKDYYDRPKENAIIMRKNYENTCNRKQL